MGTASWNQLLFKLPAAKRYFVKLTVVRIYVNQPVFGNFIILLKNDFN